MKIPPAPLKKAAVYTQVSLSTFQDVDPPPAPLKKATVYTQVNCLRFDLSQPPKSPNSGGL